MKVEGEVTDSVHRGVGLVKKYEPRLIGILGFKPHPGTMNIRLDKAVSVDSHSTKILDFVVINSGKRQIDAYLAPVKIRTTGGLKLRGVMIEGNESVTLYKWKGKDAFSLRKAGKFVTWDLIRGETDRKLIEFIKTRQEGKNIAQPAKSNEMKCWAVRFTSGPQDKLSLEIIAKTNMRDEMGLADGDRVQVEFLK